jgi:YD repeat-containing protein
MIDPQSVQTTYGYDALNRLNGLTYNGQTPNYTFGYDALSRRTSLTRPNGIATSYGYTPQSWLNSVLHKNSGGTVLDGATTTPSTTWAIERPGPTSVPMSRLRALLTPSIS